MLDMAVRDTLGDTSRYFFNLSKSADYSAENLRGVLCLSLERKMENDGEFSICPFHLHRLISIVIRTHAHQFYDSNSDLMSTMA